MAPRWPKRAPTGAQEGSKTAPRAPKTAPRAAQEGPRGLIFGPRRGGRHWLPLLSLIDGPKRVLKASKRAPREPQERPKRAPREPQGLLCRVLQGIAGSFCRVLQGSLQGSLQGLCRVLQGLLCRVLQGIAGSICRVLQGGSRGEGEGFMRSSKKELLRQLTTRDGPILTPSSCPSSASSPVLLPFQKVTDVLSLSRCMLLHFPDQSNSPEHRLCNCNAALARHSWTPNVDTCVTGRTSEQYGPIGGRMSPITYDGL